MKIKMHKQDIADLAHLNEVREGLESNHSCIKSGSLRQGDVTISWKRDSDFIAVNSKDIKI